MELKTLLSPLSIGGRIIKNRLVYPNASPHFLQGPEDYPAEAFRAFHAGLAKNGAAIVTVAEWNNPNQRVGPPDMDGTHMQSFDTRNPATHNYLSQLADEIHFYGSKIMVSVSIDYPEGYSLHGGRIMGPPHGEDTQPVPKEMIVEVIETFVQKLRFYQLLGYDGMSIRCDPDMQPVPSPRMDEYGGSLENRTRLLRTALSEVRNRLGKRFLIECVLAWEQPDGYGRETATGQGYSQQDALEFLQLTDGIVDIAQIRENSMTRSHPTGYNFRPGEHPALEFCSKAKKAGIQTLLEPIGGFQDPDEMELALRKNQCDLFGMARGFLADPAYGEKIYDGRQKDIVPCLKCNKCHGTILIPDHAPWVSVCSVNPRFGLEGKLNRMLSRIEPAKLRRVAIIGGGCAGMMAALTAARQGHQVVLYEKTDHLGGQLDHSDFFSFKWPLRAYKQWLVTQIEQSGADVHLGCAPSPDELRAGGYDAVIAATGAVSVLPAAIDGLLDLNGQPKAGVRTCTDVWGKTDELGRKITICGGSEVGMETAMYLCEHGHEVTVLTRQRELGHDASKLHYVTGSWVKHFDDGKSRERPAWEKYDNLTGIVGVTTKCVNGGTVSFEDNGTLRAIEADDVIICGGMRPCIDEALSYAGAAPRFFAIGDCNGAGNIQKCVQEAFSRAMML